VNVKFWVEVKIGCAIDCKGAGAIDCNLRDELLGGVVSFGVGNDF